ncbi:MAG: 50S ribosomal protein L19 [Deltaproteobacteria bacterium RIFCSPLOWO2_02_FULL_46_8]|nr:MAG: 50S ribosomal protein L19 [Deltaproteobacteria bacterium RIFCSPLOWO2_02_FULL_46_8]
MNLMQKIEEAYCKKGIPDFRPGDTVRIFVKIKEGEKERLQAFEGVVLRSRGAGSAASFTVRKVSYGVGVERIFPLHSPIIDRIEIIQKGKVRRSRLYYLRKLSGRKARIEGEERFVTEETKPKEQQPS